MNSNNNIECYTSKAIEELSPNCISGKEIVTRVKEALEKGQLSECKRIMNDVNICIMRRCMCISKIVKEALNNSTDECFIYLFDKLSIVFDNEELRLLLFGATNYGDNFMNKISYLVNHDKMKKIVSMENLCCDNKHNLLEMPNHMYYSKFIRFLNSKFMNKNAFDSTKIKGIPILEYLFLSACGADVYNENPKISLRFILGRLRGWETDADNAILSVIELGFVTRESFVQSNGKIYDWFHTTNAKIYKILVEKQFLIGDELLIYYRKEHYVKYRIVMYDIRDLKEKNDEISRRQKEICLLQEEIKQHQEHIKKLFKSSK